MKRKALQFGVFLMAAPLVVLLDGCDSSPTFATLQPTLKVSCALPSCHGSSQQGMLSLLPSDGYCDLVGAMQGETFRPTAFSQFPRRVVVGHRDQSFLYKKLTLTSAEAGSQKPLGDVMPQGQAFTDQSLIEQFGRWIDDGAKDENGQPAPGSCL